MHEEREAVKDQGSLRLQTYQEGTYLKRKVNVFCSEYKM